MTTGNASAARFAEKYGRWAVIAGASEGTGAEFARQLADAGLNLMLVSRRADALEDLAQRLRDGRSIQTRTLALDLSAPDAPHRMFAAAADIEVGLYVSNAGADTDFRPVLDRPLEAMQSLIQFNVSNVTTACYLFLRAMRLRNRGGAVIMSSVSGLVGGQPGSGLYSATKAFELVLAESLHIELRPHNVDVIGVAAPPMATPAAVRALEQAGTASPNVISALYKPADVVRTVLSMLGKTPSCVFDFVGVDTELGAVTASARHRRIKAVEAAVAKLFPPAK